MKQLDEKEKEFYIRVVDYLESFHDMKERLAATTINTHSGDNGVLMRGPFAGHSICELIEYVARVQEKESRYISDGY